MHNEENGSTDNIRSIRYKFDMSDETIFFSNCVGMSQCAYKTNIPLRVVHTI